MNDLVTKKVSLIELFYDLVFVYMISQATGLIHHLHNGVIGLSTFSIFALVVILFINSWMIQTVFINRYGNDSWSNKLFIFINMAVVLYMSNSFSSTFNHQLTPFFGAAALLSLTQTMQYVIVYLKTTQNADKQITLAFSGILATRTLALTIGAAVQNQLGLLTALLGIMISWIAPSFTGKLTVRRPIIFSHLLERVTALIIIMFGEMIVGIAEYFTQRTVSPYSLLLFVLVALLFMTYATEFSDLIEEKQGRETGNRLIYLHYFILFGLSLITVAIKFIHSTNANLIFSVGCLYMGLLLFYVGILLGGIYNEVSFKIGSRRVCWIIGFTLLGWGGTLQLKNATEIIFITVVVALLNLLILARIGQNGTSRQKIQ